MQPGQPAESAKTIHCTIIKCAFHKNRDQPPLGAAIWLQTRRLLVIGIIIIVCPIELCHGQSITIRLECSLNITA